MSAWSKIGFQDDMRLAADTSWYWAQHSDQVLNAVLLMADRQDLLLARRVGDLRRKVLELAAIIEEPDAHDSHS
jgi:hypothetical protein